MPVSDTETAYPSSQVELSLPTSEQLRPAPHSVFESYEPLPARPPRKSFAEPLRGILPLEEVLGMNLFAKLGMVLLVFGFALLGSVALIAMGPIGMSRTADSGSDSGLTSTASIAFIPQARVSLDVDTPEEASIRAEMRTHHRAGAFSRSALP